jgi:phytoene synthase
MCALYAFLRLSDDLADSTNPVESRRQALDDWRARTERMLQGDYSHPIHPAFHHTVRTHGIPARYLFEALDGVGMDLDIQRYATFAELYRYCYRVASVVGLACIHIWGFRDERALPHAEEAGVAFQLTNILRDLAEDAARGRVYLPGEDLERFGYTPEQLQRGERGPAFVALMRFQVERARAYYLRSRALAPWLSAPGKAVFRVMHGTYGGLLERIERGHYDVFTQRVRLSRWRKLGLVLLALPIRWGLWG